MKGKFHRGFLHWLLLVSTVLFNACGGGGGGSGGSGGGTEPTIPDAPTTLTQTAVSQTSVSLGWVDASGNEESFELELSTDGGSSWSLLDTLSENTTVYTHNGLTAETSYDYRIRATNGEGASDYSNELSVTTLPPAPNAPSALSTGAIDTVSVELTWIDNADNESGFELERSDDSGASWTQAATPAADTTSLTDTSLDPATDYQYRLRAVNAGGVSAWVTVSATTQTPDYLHVSTTGDDDSGNGTIESPWQTLEHALGQVSSGQSIRMAEGTYPETALVWPDDQVNLEGGWNEAFDSRDAVTQQVIIEQSDTTPDSPLFLLEDVTDVEFSGLQLVNDYGIGVFDTPVIHVTGVNSLSNVMEIRLDDVDISARSASTDDRAVGILIGDTQFFSSSAVFNVEVVNSNIQVLNPVAVPIDLSNGGWGIYNRQEEGTVTLTNTTVTVADGFKYAFRSDGGNVTIDGGEFSAGQANADIGTVYFANSGRDHRDVIIRNAILSGHDSQRRSRALWIASAPESLLIEDNTVTTGNAGQNDPASNFSSQGVLVSPQGTSKVINDLIIRNNSVTLEGSCGGGSDCAVVGINVTLAEGNQFHVDGNSILVSPTVDVGAGRLVGIQTGYAFSSAGYVINNVVRRQNDASGRFDAFYDLSAPTGGTLLIANNTVRSTNDGTGDGLFGFYLDLRGPGAELVNNIVVAGSEANQVAVAIEELGSNFRPDRVESNYLDAVVLARTGSVSFNNYTAVSDVNDATLVTRDTGSDGLGDGVAQDNVTGLSDGLDISARLTASSAVVLREGAVDLSADFDVDTNGNTRSTGVTNGADWSFGAYEY
jgi:hypothetical protein